jgi:hypothetical protein
MTCSITDLPSCIVTEGINALQHLINQPIQPIIDLVKLLLTQPATIEPLAPIWAIMVYVISLFYGLVLLWAGISFIIGGSSPQRRERAKEWLQNAILMIVSVQASYYIYLLLTDLAAKLTTGVVSLINPNFFLITIDNPVNIGFELIFGFLYVNTLTLTCLVLGIAYIVSSIGVVFFPIGLFLWFIPPLRDVGKYILSKVIFIVFLPFFASLILLTASLLAGTGPFVNAKVLLAILAFGAINLWFIIMALLVIIRSVFAVLRSDIAQAFLMVKGYFVAAMAVETSKPGMRPR